VDKYVEPFEVFSYFSSSISRNTSMWEGEMISEFQGAVRWGCAGSERAILGVVPIHLLLRLSHRVA
jgi:hypothetical protein